MRRKQHKFTKNSDDVYVHVHDHESDNNSDESRTVLFIGGVDEEIVKTTSEKLIYLSEKNATAPIHLIINTHGGYIYDALMLYDLIKFIPAPVYTVGLGKIMSAGCLLLAAGARRKMGSNATLMYHACWDQAEGNVWQIQSSLDELKRLNDKYDELFAKETGLTLAAVKKLYNSRGPTADKYFTANDCLKLNIVDELI